LLLFQKHIIENQSIFEVIKFENELKIHFLLPGVWVLPNVISMTDWSELTISSCFFSETSTALVSATSEMSSSSATLSGCS
jgi:hypothetical protein